MDPRSGDENVSWNVDQGENLAPPNRHGEQHGKVKQQIYRTQKEAGGDKAFPVQERIVDPAHDPLVYSVGPLTISKTKTLKEALEILIKFLQEEDKQTLTKTND